MNLEKEILENKVYIKKLEMQIEAMKKALYKEGILVESDFNDIFDELIEDVDKKI